MRKLLMTASALAMGAAGLLASFLPQELLRLIRAPEELVLALAIQLLGALYLAFALVNWTAKGSLIGGIYNRPVALGNLLHFLMGALAIGKVAIAWPEVPLLVPLMAVVYAIFAIAFAWTMFTSPVAAVPGRGAEQAE